MNQIKKLALALLPMMVLSLAGCGSSSSGGNSVADPLRSGSTSNQVGQVDQGGQANQGGTVTTPTPAPKVSLTVTTDLAKPADLTKLPQVDANIGTVLLTAKMLNVGDSVIINAVTSEPIVKDAPIPDQSVSFNVIAGPGTITYSTPVSDRNGESHAILTTGNADYTTNVIVEASTTVSGKIYRGYTQFQIVRGSGKIELSNEQDIPPYELPADFPKGDPFHILHQFSFKLTDSNGNPRVGVPVTLSVHSSVPPTPVFLDYSTIKTGSDGVGWFNAAVVLFGPGPGLPDSASIIYKARTSDPHPIINYKGSTYSVVQKPLSSARK